MRISVFGLGYVGSVSCGCLADLGHHVIGVDVVDAKVDLIRQGKAPVIEDGLAECLAAALKDGRLGATKSASEAVADSDVALVCVGTPSTRSGAVNTKYLEAVCAEIGQAIKEHQPEHYVILNRSTSIAPIHRRLIEILERESGRTVGNGLGYVCHPEFLREGVAVEDFYNPPKIVFGATDEKTEAICRALYPNIDAPTFFVSPEVASMVKYADNCFHALKVTFGNEIGLISKELGVDAREVMKIFCRDTKLNISPKYLMPGLAFGGSCLPKDLRGILDASRETATPLPMLDGTLQSNRHQIEQLLRRIISPKRPTVGIVGLAFKEGTDDVRESPVVSIVEQLCGKGHPVRIYDAHLSLQKMVGANLSFALQSIPHLAELLTDDLQAVIDAADVVLISHKLKPEIWSKVKFRDDQQIIDLVGIDELKDQKGYDGLYW